MYFPFHFRNFTPEDTLKKEANRALDSILNFSPYGSSAVALLEKEANKFRCSVHVYTWHGPFIAEMTHDDPSSVISHVEETLIKKLSRGAQEETESQLDTRQFESQNNKHPPDDPAVSLVPRERGERLKNRWTLMTH